jgi:hypothetical protein
MRKFASKFAVLFLFLFATVGVITAQTDDATRIFEPLDRGLNYRFTYPLATHSVRTTNLFELATSEPIVFGGQVAVEPNDSYLYAGPDVPESAATQMRILAIPTAEAPASLADLIGMLPLWQRDAIGSDVQEITLGGQPAVRVDDSDRQATEIIAYYDGVIYEIVIDVVPLSLGFRLPEGTTYAPVYDDILASWEFVDLAA